MDGSLTHAYTSKKLVVPCRLPSGSSNLIVATHTCNILVYQGDKVVWLAKAPTVPVAIRVAEVGPLQAALVILDDEGLLSVCYLGTAPPTAVLGLSESREPEWEKVQVRRKELMRIIKAKTAGNPDDQPHAPAHASGCLNIRSQVRPKRPAIKCVEALRC